MALGGKQSALYKAQALGATLLSSSYGATIPVWFGRTKGALNLIWAANLRQGASSKGAKKNAAGGGIFGGLFGGSPTYVQNVDFLVGHNPVSGPLQFWLNTTQLLPLDFQVVSTSITQGGISSFTISDPKFYSVLAVTITQTYSVTFSDYGGGSETLSGEYEVPLWNAAFTGPDPTNPSAYRQFPWSYFWVPGSGATIYLPNCALGLLPGFQTSGTLNVYYAQLDPVGSANYDKKFGGHDVPAAALNLTWEPVLGDGPEYTGGLSAQQILYPHYAGLGSAELDLGTGTSIPDIRPEIQGMYGVYASGDADFADMVEDIIKQGLSQAGFGNPTGSFSPIQRGLSCFNLPGCVQKKLAYSTASFSTVQLDQPPTEGNILLVYSQNASSISDTNANTWTNIEGGGWYAIANNANPGDLDVITAATSDGALVALEISGVDTIDSITLGSGTSMSVTTTNVYNQPGYILAVVDDGFGASQQAPVIPWRSEISYGTVGLDIESRTVYSPGTYTFPIRGSSPPFAFLVAMKTAQPPTYPRPLTDIIDDATMQLTRNQCRANGLWGSLVMDTQKNASDWLKDLYTCMDAWPLWSGFVLKSIPRSEVSAVGNGAIYVAPTSTGPVYNLQEGNFVGDASQPLVTVEREAQVDTPNLLQIQFANRASQYNDVIVSQPETSAIALYGPRKDSPQQLDMVKDPTVARMIMGAEIRSQNYLRNKYKFTLKANFKLLEPGDLVTIPITCFMPNPGNVA